MTLTFEASASDNEKIEIHADLEGLKNLRNYIDHLILTDLDDGIQINAHLMVPEWGGSELTGVQVGMRNKLIKHVKIFKWTDEFFDVATT